MFSWQLVDNWILLILQTENFSIIYGYDGITFQQHFINQNNGNRYQRQVALYWLSNMSDSLKEVICYLSLLILVSQRICSTFFSKDHKYRLQCYYTEPESGLLSDAFKVERYWKLHKYLQPNSWLEKWLKRELQALLQVSYSRLSYALQSSSKLSAGIFIYSWYFAFFAVMKFFLCVHVLAFS